MPLLLEWYAQLASLRCHSSLLLGRTQLSFPAITARFSSSPQLAGVVDERAVVAVRRMKHEARQFGVARRWGHPWRAFSFRSARHVRDRSEEHTSELQSPCNIVCRLLL